MCDATLQTSHASVHPGTRALCALQDPLPGVVAHPFPSNLLEWHFVLEGGKGTEYESGVYHGIMQFPPAYPYRPPSLQMLTPSGRFAVSQKICLSNTDYHAETWCVWSQKRQCPQGTLQGADVRSCSAILPAGVWHSELASLWPACGCLICPSAYAALGVGTPAVMEHEAWPPSTLIYPMLITGAAWVPAGTPHGARAPSWWACSRS